MPTPTQPLQSFFFPNPYGDNQPVTIEAASLEDAIAQLQALKAPVVADKPAANPSPAPEKAPVPAEVSAEKEA